MTKPVGTNPPTVTKTKKKKASKPKDKPEDKQTTPPTFTYTETEVEKTPTPDRELRITASTDAETTENPSLLKPDVVYTGVHTPVTIGETC